MLIFIYNRLKSLNCTVYILKTISLAMKTRKGVRESISDLHNSCFENVSRVDLGMYIGPAFFQIHVR